MKYMCHIPSSYGSGAIVKKKTKQRDCKCQRQLDEHKQVLFPRQNRTHEFTTVLAAWTRPAQSQANPSVEIGVPPPTEEVLANDSFWKRESQRFLRV